MRLRSALLAATVLATPIVAKAQPINGLYIGAGVGANFRLSQNMTGVSSTLGPLGGAVFTFPSSSPFLSLTQPTLYTDPGFVGLGSVGWGFGNGLRVEVEGNWRYNTISTLHNSPIVSGFPTAGGGNVQTYGVLANVLYDIDITRWTHGYRWVVPYVGVGAGYAWTNFTNFHAYGVTFPYNFSSTTSNGNFAYQAIAGISIPVSTIPNLAITAEYRFFSQIGTNDFHGSIFTGPPQLPLGKTFLSYKLNPSYNNAVLVGVRYNFAPPPPPPPPVVTPPPVQPARSYLVFFDWDKATLTDRARQIIREAADNSRRVQYTRIEVNGYTDTSGTPRYNLGLSIRRAQAVAAELVRDGVPREAISIHGFGQTHLLVPTGPGVREPQNRRVEIIIQ
ncbi:MAG: OmpA family protein [Acetobacteraceae bacterium]|nr:OmpA family protein [Acetobacteraceae bacterium]MBV8524377.1 OmpA family protein [Acetobacteraceae bacterium]